MNVVMVGNAGSLLKATTEENVSFRGWRVVDDALHNWHNIRRGGAA